MIRVKSALICLNILFLFFTLGAHAEEDPEDMVDIFEADGKIIAVIEGRNTQPLMLRSREILLQSMADGYLGGVLTNHRFLVISTSSGGWQALALRKGESEKAVTALSPCLALLVGKDRAVGFDARNDRFIETRLHIKDKLVTVKMGKKVAVVILSGHAYGLAAGASAFDEIRLRNRETTESVKITSGKAILQTSDRLLYFDASGASWREYPLN
ncbi:MAG: hypothetical protein MI799_15995 [Desulfobacterales bacterium]|nr:hypothetical protein [Desulfobacterales bacterium]